MLKALVQNMENGLTSMLLKEEHSNTTLDVSYTRLCLICIFCLLLNCL